MPLVFAYGSWIGGTGFAQNINSIVDPLSTPATVDNNNVVALSAAGTLLPLFVFLSSVSAEHL
jgi:hypothetical protein